jgi:hypothetical protein
VNKNIGVKFVEAALVTPVASDPEPLLIPPLLPPLPVDESGCVTLDKVQEGVKTYFKITDTRFCISTLQGDSRSRLVLSEIEAPNVMIPRR